MIAEESVLLLKEAGVYTTYNRLVVLNTFLKSGRVMDQSELYRSHSNDLDRTTIYRTLQLFVQKKILYIVPTSNNVIRYALRTVDKPTPRKHLHLICEKCGHVDDSKNDIDPSVLNIPEGFEFGDIDIIIKGLCQKCRGIG